MATFKIEGLVTIFGEKELTPENGHIATDWEAYLDGVKVKESLYDTVNLTEWHIGLIGNDGKPFDGSNGEIFGRVRVYVNNLVSEYFVIACPPKLTVASDSVIYPMESRTLPEAIRFKRNDGVTIYGNIETIRDLTATIVRPTVTINRKTN